MVHGQCVHCSQTQTVLVPDVGYLACLCRIQCVEDTAGCHTGYIELQKGSSSLKLRKWKKHF